MKFIENLICPICGKNLFENNRSLLCESGHCFDISKEGYVNLLFPGGKSGDLTGDNSEDIETLFKMTPYYYRTSAEGKKRLQSIHSLETTVEFVAGVYEKSGA